MKNSINLLKVVYILLIIQIAWFIVSLERQFGIISFLVPLFLTVVSSVVTMIVIGLLKEKISNKNWIIIWIILSFIYIIYVFTNVRYELRYVLDVKLNNKL